MVIGSYRPAQPILDQASEMDTTEAEALAENTRVLKELTTLLASTLDAASLLLSAISAKAKKPKK